MERESNPMQALCRSGCGFYGSPATDGLCSLCYKEVLKKKQQLPTATPASLNPLRETATAHPTVISMTSEVPLETVDDDAPNNGATTSSSVVILDTDAEENNLNNSTTTSLLSPAAVNLEDVSQNQNDDDKDGDKEAKKKKNRCATCRKKVGLTGFECRCGGLFCAVHRYSDKHDCSFNYREMGAQEIRRNNPVVVGEKIQKI